MRDAPAADRRDEVAAAHGPWIGWNIRLGPDVTTMGHEDVGTPELMVHSVVQAVADLTSKPLDQLRVLDLGSHEGGYAIELGLHGATVVGIEGRPSNIAKARFAADELGLDAVTFIEADVRTIDEAEVGRFDVVLCLGILYHLPAADAVRLLRRCYAMCDQLTIIRSAIGLSENIAESVDGLTYGGRRYTERTEQAGASLGNAYSVLPTRGSLLNVLADIGYTSVSEILNPVVPSLEVTTDSVTLAAVRGQPVEHRSFPGLTAVAQAQRRQSRPVPWFARTAHPQQGPYWQLRERLTHSFARSVFQSRRPVESWRDRAR